MIYNIIGTTFSRGIIAILGLLTLILNTRYLGAEKIGELAIYIIVITALVQVSEFIGGPSIVYLQKKFSTKHLLSVSYGWALIVAVIAFFSLHLVENIYLLPTKILISIAFFQSINHIHLHMLVGREKITAYNLSALAQSIAITTGISYIYIVKSEATVLNYLHIYFIAVGISLICTTWYILQLKSRTLIDSNYSQMLREIINYGAIIQTTNLLQFGVYRFNYLILESFTSIMNLGIYSVGNQLSEKALIPGNAISLVQYSSIANSQKKEQAIDLTFKMIVLSSLITLATILVLLLTPNELFTLILGNDFTEISYLFLILAPGVFALSISTIYSHYFAGLGLYKYNLITSGIGLVLSILIALVLIPFAGMNGAAVAASLVFIVQTIIQTVLFRNETKLSWKEIVSYHMEAFQYYIQKTKGFLNVRH